MSTDTAKTLVTTYIEDVWNRADAQALEQLTTTSFTYTLGGQPPRDRTAMLAFLQGVHAAFPDWRVQIDDIVAEDSSVAVRWSGQVTHEGPFHGIPPTGKHIAVSGINLYRIEDGRIAQEWEQMDSLGMLAQLGVLPPAGPQ